MTKKPEEDTHVDPAPELEPPTGVYHPGRVWLEPLGWSNPDNLTFDEMIAVEAER